MKKGLGAGFTILMGLLSGWDSLWVAESDEDDIFTIRKYRLGL